MYIDANFEENLDGVLVAILAGLLIRIIMVSSACNIFWCSFSNIILVQKPYYYDVIYYNIIYKHRPKYKERFKIQYQNPKTNKTIEMITK